MKKTIFSWSLLVAFFLIFTAASFTVSIDVDDSDKGGFTVKNALIAEKKYKLILQKGKDQLIYDILKEEESFSFTYGTGTYEILLMENVKKNQYKLLEQKKIKVEFEEQAPFLLSTQQVNWGKDKNIIKTAKALVEDEKSDKGKVEKIYEKILETVAYDEKKALEVNIGYVPDLGKILEEKSGICYDYAALLAGFLRSVEIPAKLIKGYRKDIEAYHAWNEVYIDGAWVVIDPTLGATHQNPDRLKEMVQNKDMYQINSVY